MALVGNDRPKKAQITGPDGKKVVKFDINPEKINSQLGQTVINISGGGVNPQDSSSTTNGTAVVKSNATTSPGQNAPKTPKFQFKGYLMASGSGDMTPQTVMSDALTLQMWCTPAPAAPPGGGGNNKNKSGNPAQGQVTTDQKTVVFDWGTAFSQVKGTITAVTVDFLTFDDDGYPLIASVDVTIQTDSAYQPPQNPTSGGTAPIGAHEVIAGDSLPSIAYQAYGRASYWRQLAVENNIDDPLRLPAGSMLRLPVIQELARTGD